ncbi:MAG: nitronate monooxygenase [Deltaproteobacteria bacterium]|nr:MAG: nitronate monooxygenase [Deltaproteobacteria bacterium]
MTSFLRTAFAPSTVGGLYAGSPYSLALPKPLMDALVAVATRFSLGSSQSQGFSDTSGSTVVEFDLRGIVAGLLEGGNLSSAEELDPVVIDHLTRYVSGDDIALDSLVVPLQKLVSAYGVSISEDLSASPARFVIVPQDLGAARKAMFVHSAGALPAHVLSQVHELKVALGNAESVVAGLESARHATKAQSDAINQVWMSLARLDRVMDVEAYKGPEKIGEIKSLIAGAEKFLDDLGLKPMAQDALAMREKKARFYLTAPGQANEAIDFLRTVYHRSKAAKRFVDEVVVPALSKFSIPVDQLVDPNYELTPAIRENLGGSKISQPLILATQLAALEELKSYGYDPQYLEAALGDSQGTLLALVAGGYEDPAEAIAMVAVNGIGMDSVSRFYKGKISMIATLGLSRKDLNQICLAVNLHAALMSGVEGEFKGLTGAEKQELLERFQDQLLYGNLLPVSQMIEDEALRERFSFLKKLKERAYFVEQAQAELLGLPEDLSGLEEIAHLLMNPKAKTSYPTLVHSPNDADRALGVPPSVVVSGHNESNRLLLSILGNKDLNTQPHASIKMVGFNFEKGEETVFPKTQILPTSAPFHHFGYMLPSQENILAQAQGGFKEGGVPVYVNSRAVAVNELSHPDGRLFTPRERKEWVLKEQHTRNVRLERSLEAMLTRGDQSLPAYVIDIGPDAIEDKFNREILGGRATCLAWGKGGYSRLTSRKPIQLEAEQSVLSDPSFYQPVEKQVTAGRPLVDGEYLGPIAYLSQVHLADDVERAQLIKDIERVADLSGDQPAWREDLFLKATGAEGPYGQAAMTGPGSAKLTGAVARQRRNAFLAFGNYPPQAYRGIGIEDAALAGIIDTAWETTRSVDPITGLPIDSGDFAYDGDLLVRGNLDTYGDRALEDQERFTDVEGQFSGSMKSFGGNYMHSTDPRFRYNQVSAHVRALDMGIPMNKASIGLYQASLDELRLYIPLLARGVIYLPLLANLANIEKYQSEQIEFLKAELKKYFEGGWKTYNQEMAAVYKEKYAFAEEPLPTIFQSDLYHQNLQTQHPEYFKAGGFDAFMKKNQHIFGKGREGNDGGGHNAVDGTPTYRLMQAAIREARASGNKEKVPNLAAGGFADGVAVADALLSFASGVMVGTIFEVTEEADLPYEVKKLFMQAADSKHPRSFLNMTSEYGKPLNVIQNAFAMAYRDLIATDNAEELLNILKREPIESIRLHREYWNRGIETQDPALGLVTKNRAVFEALWDYLEGKSENRQAAIDAIARLVEEERVKAKTKFDEANAKAEAKDKKIWNPRRDNPKDQLITFFRVFRTNMVQNGRVDPEWAYVLGGRSITRMPERFITRFQETGQLPTAKELIETVEADALNYLVQLYKKAKNVEWERGQTYPTRTFDRLSGVSYEKLPLAEGGDVVRVALSGTFSEETIKEFRKTAKAQGHGVVAHVLRSFDMFDRFFTPHAGREFSFRLDASANPNRPELISVNVMEGGRVVADVKCVDGIVVMTRHMMVKGQERSLEYRFEKKEQNGVLEWVLDRESLQESSSKVFDEQLTGTFYDHANQPVTAPIQINRPASPEKVARYNAIVGEGYAMFVEGAVAHPGYVAVQSLDAGVHAAIHPDFKADRSLLLHGYIEQRFGQSLPLGPEFQCEARNISAKPLEPGQTKGAFSQDMHVVSRDPKGKIISEVTTGFVNRDPHAEFPQDLDEKVSPVLPKDNGKKVFRGFDRYPIFQAFTTVTRQQIRDYEEFDANSIHHVEFDAQMGGLEKGIIAQGMLVRGKMMSHMIAGYLKGNLTRVISEKTTWMGTVNPDEQLNLVLYREGQQGGQDILVYEATDSNGKSCYEAGVGCYS